MMKTIIAIKFLVLLFQLIWPSTASRSPCPGFTLVGDTSCTNSKLFASSSINVSCSEDAETVAVSGTVTARSAFDGDSEVLFTPCLRMTGICFHEYEQSGGKICDLISATSSSSSDCGSAGTYSIDQAFDVPDEVITKVNNHGWVMKFVTIRARIGNEEACTQDVTTTSTAATSDGYLMVGVASLFIVSGISLFFSHRRRTPLIVLEEENDTETNTVRNFVQMIDMPQHLA